MPRGVAHSVSHELFNVVLSDLNDVCPSSLSEKRSNDSNVPTYNLWLSLNDSDERIKYSRYQEKGVSIVAILASTLITSSVYTYLAILSYIEGDDYFFATLRITRACICSLGFLYAFVEYKRRDAVKEIPTAVFATTDTNFWPQFRLSYLSDVYMITFAFVGGVILLTKTMRGHCDDGFKNAACNPKGDENGLPTGTLLTNIASLIIIPILYKAHDKLCVALSYLIAVSFVIATIIACKV